MTLCLILGWSYLSTQKIIYLWDCLMKSVSSTSFSVNMLSKKALSTVSRHHSTLYIQSQCFISVHCSCTQLNLIYDTGSGQSDEMKNIFLKKWIIPGLFFFIFVFSIQFLIQLIVKKMSGIEPQISDVGSPWN